MCVCVCTRPPGMYTYISTTELLNVLGTQDPFEDFVKKTDSEQGDLAWAMR